MSQPVSAAPRRARPGGGLVMLIAAAIAVVLLLVVLVAILGDRFRGPSERRVTIEDDRIAVELMLPDEVGITRVSARADDGCGHAAYSFGPDLMLEMYSTDCGELSNDRGPLNGFHGAYRSIEDVQDPQNVEEIETGLGTAQVFTQQYTECTNACQDFQEPVAIIELDDPVDPAFPSVVLLGQKGEVSREDLIGILETLRSLEDPV